MNYLLNRPNFPFNDVKVPVGLEQLLNDISREVLRSQPKTENIYDCIAIYLEKIIITRDAIEGVEGLLTGIINKAADIAQDLRNDGLECEKAEAVAEVIRCYFEKFITKKRKEKYGAINFQFKEIDFICELMNKCKMSEKEVLRSQSTIFEAYRKFVTNYLKALEGSILPPDMLDCAMQMTIDRYVTEIPTFAVLHKAATTIKAAIKGHIIRRKIRDFKFLVTKASEYHVNTRLKSHRSRSEIEVVLLILTYWNSALSKEHVHLQRPETFRNVVKSVNDGDIRNFLNYSPTNKSKNLYLTNEDIAAIKIQRIYRRYRLRKDSVSPKKFSLLQPMSSFLNLLPLSNDDSSKDYTSSDEEKI